MQLTYEFEFVHIQHMSKRMQQFVKICAALFDKIPHIYGLPLDLCRKRRIWNCGAFCQTSRNSANMLHFHGKKTAHCGAAIKVRRTWWEKSGAHGTTFSRAATARLLHIFFTYTVNTTFGFYCKRSEPPHEVNGHAVYISYVNLVLWGPRAMRKRNRLNEVAQYKINRML